MKFCLEKRTNDYDMIPDDERGRSFRASPYERWLPIDEFNDEESAKQRAEKEVEGVNFFNFFQWQNAYYNDIQLGEYMQMAGGRTVHFRIIRRES